MHDTNDKYFSMMGLLDEGKLAGVNNHGYWYNFNSLHNVLGLMKKNETGKEDKHSIPDVYGRAIQYKISFESTYNKSVIGKKYFYSKEIFNWRGIITAIALQDFLELEMKIDSIDYTDNETAFDKALMHPPTAELFKDEKNWENLKFHILTLKGDDAAEYTDIAMFSQLTVFYPMADLEKKMPKVANISWFDYNKRVFLNPAEVLSDTEKMIVGFWAQHFRKILIQEGPAAEVMLYHLDAYIKEIELDGNAQGSKCFDLRIYDEEYNKVMPNSVINSIMNQTVRRQLNIGAAGMIDYKDIFAEQIYYTKKKITSFAQSPFFENYCIKSGSKESVSDQWYAFLPLGKKIAKIGNQAIVHKLAKSINMEVSYNNEEKKPEYIQVIFLLSKIDPALIDAEKRYYFSKQDQVVEESANFPTISVWPPDYVQGCKKYYIYLQGGKTGKIEVTLDNAVTGTNPYVKSVNNFPSAISLQRISESGSKAYDIGMVIPEYNDEPYQNGVAVTALVGIDFGTSGTTVYVKIPGKTSFSVEIGRDSSKLLTSAGESELAFMSQWFIANNLEGMVSSKLHSVYRRASKKKLQTVIPILDGVIYQADEEEMIEDSKYFMPDIKWNDPMKGAYYEAFIEELCVHIWMKLREYDVTAIEWRYAFPSSLNQRTLYQEIWNKNIQAFLNQNITNVHHIFEELNFTESEAVSLYFQTSNEMEIVNIEKGYVVVDIGGGSTDIAVWQKQNQGEGVTMISQISVPVAGRMLFTRLLSVNLLTIQREVFPNDNELKRLKDFKGDIDIVNAILERIVHTKQDIIMRSYQGKSQWAVELKEQLEFGIALLFFALGSFIGYLQQSGNLNVQGTKGKFSIALGGNGSKILNWLDDEDHAKLLELFQEGIRSRDNNLQTYSSQIISSARPKEEVALGLLQDKRNMRKASINVIETITADMAIDWNRIFIKKYNKLFNQNVNAVEDDIYALMANEYKPTNVCDFFMTIMYKMHYIKQIGSRKERRIKDE